MLTAGGAAGMLHAASQSYSTLLRGHTAAIADLVLHPSRHHPSSALSTHTPCSEKFRRGI